MTPKEIRSYLDKNSIQVKPKTSSKLMRFIGWFLAIRWFWKWPINIKFMSVYTTVINRDVYYPSSWGIFDLDNDRHVTSHAVTFEHEFVHVEQRKKWKILWQLTYLFFPVPFFFAWGRWRWEREAYKVNLRNGRSIDSVVNTLWKYGWPWPKSWMKKWFEENY